MVEPARSIVFLKVWGDFNNFYKQKKKKYSGEGGRGTYLSLSSLFLLIFLYPPPERYIPVELDLNTKH